MDKINFPTCHSEISFADDFGDNSTTFYCNLSRNHKGKHQETGIMYGKIYKLTWNDEVEEPDYNDESRFKE